MLLRQDDEDENDVDLENGEGGPLDDEAQQAIEKFRTEMDALTTEVENVEKSTQELQSLFEASLRSAKEKPENKAQTEEILKENDHQAQSLRKRLRKLGDENRQFKKDYPKSISELKLRVTQHQALARRFMAAMQDFEAVQDNHRRAVNKKLEQYLKRMNPEASADEIARAVRNGEASQFADGGTQFAQLPPEERERLQRGLADLNSRNEDIRKLEESIVQLHQLFVDMQIMVEAQGELVNQAEYDVGETKTAAASALDELVTAREHQKSAQKKKCWMIVIIVAIIIAVAVALLIKFAPNWVIRQKKRIIDTITGGNSTATPPPVSPPPANATMPLVPIKGSNVMPDVPADGGQVEVSSLAGHLFANGTLAS